MEEGMEERMEAGIEERIEDEDWRGREEWMDEF